MFYITKYHINQEQGPISKSCSSTKSSQAQSNFAYQNKVTSQATISHVQFLTGILLISAKQTIVKMQLYETDPWKTKTKMVTAQ